MTEIEKKISNFLVLINDPVYITNQVKSIKPQLVRHYGLTSLENTGNTCYINAIIQCLRHTRELNSVLSQDKTKLTMLKNLPTMPLGIILLVNYIKMIQTMCLYDNSKLTPISFKILLAKNFSQFNDHEQHDAHELLIYILQSFHESLSCNVKYNITGTIMNETDKLVKQAHDDWITYYKNKNSIILDVFTGQICKRFQCLYCQHTNTRFDPLMVMDLPVDNTSTLYQCLDNFVACEQLTEDNAYTCDQCNKKTRALTSSLFWKLPNILIIKLNRFKHTLFNGFVRTHKIENLIEFPITELNISKYSAPHINDCTTYRLYAICHHMGTLSTGHYYASCYDPHKKTWFTYNDTHISPIDNPLDLIKQDAYILFYQNTCSYTGISN